jgi:hypothetical protein
MGMTPAYTDAAEHKYGKNICVDFDGTVVEWDFPRIGKMYPHVKEVFEELHKLGYRIVISSCRTNNKLSSPEEIMKHYNAMRKSLEENNIPFDEIDDGSHGKVIADLYIDDRGLHFNPEAGGWLAVLAEVRRRKGLVGSYDI